MSTVTRPELSKRNKYWISKHRYYELKHFCLQYHEWKQKLDVLNVRYSVVHGEIKPIQVSKPTEELAMKRLRYSEQMDMVKKACKQTEPMLAKYIFEAVTHGYSYEQLMARFEIPCSKSMYYRLYRKFFYILDKLR